MEVLLVVFKNILVCHVMSQNYDVKYGIIKSSPLQGMFYCYDYSIEYGILFTGNFSFFVALIIWVYGIFNINIYSTYLRILMTYYDSNYVLEILIKAQLDEIVIVLMIL